MAVVVLGHRSQRDTADGLRRQSSAGRGGLGPVLLGKTVLHDGGGVWKQV